MESLYRSTLPSLPLCVIQLGESPLLRGCPDWMLDILKEKGKFKGQILIISSDQNDPERNINDQDGLFTVVEQGIRNGQKEEHQRLVSIIRGSINAQTEWQEAINAFTEQEIQFVFYQASATQLTNTEEVRDEGHPPTSNPALLAELLYQRFLTYHGHEDKGLILFLFNNLSENASLLKEQILRYAALGKLPVTFTLWVDNDCLFLNALADRRIIEDAPGLPTGQETETGYGDAFMTRVEPYCRLILEAPESMEKELPFQSAGLHVLYTDNLAPYIQANERLIEGIPLMGAFPAFLSGETSMAGIMNDPDLKKYVRETTMGEILPTLILPEKEKEEYASAVLERLENPYCAQGLSIILRNGLQKWTNCVLPILEDYYRQKGRLPVLLSTSLASLIRYYLVVRTDAGFEGNLKNTTYKVEDKYSTLFFFAKASLEYQETQNLSALVKNILGNTSLWKRDLNTLPGLAELVEEKLHLLLSIGSLYTIRHAS